MSEEQNLTSADLVGLDLRDVTDRDSAIEQVLDALERVGRLVDRDQLRADLLAREEAGSTALPGGVAIPHARSAGVSAQSVALVRVRRPIAWNEGAAPVDLVLALLCPADDRDGYLRLLAAVTKGVVGRMPRDLRAADTEDDAARILESALARR